MRARPSDRKVPVSAGIQKWIVRTVKENVTSPGVFYAELIQKYWRSELDKLKEEHENAP